MPDNCKEYSGITRAAVGKLRDEAAKGGVTLPAGDSFTLEKSGVKLSVEYTESAQTLKICIVEKPMFIPDTMVWGIVDDQVKRAN